MFNILNPVDISFGEKGIACNPKTFHKRNTMMPYESTYDTSNNITNTEQNINPKSRQKKVYLKTKYCLPKEEKSKRHSVELKNRIEQKGFSILNILELSSKDVQS